jgi:hypothetical protein
MKSKRIVRLFGLFFSLPLTLLLLAMTYNKTQSRQIEAHKDMLTKSIGSVTAAVSVYAQEHGNRLPPAANWEQALQPNTGPIPLDLPHAPGGVGNRIAMNQALAGRQLNTISRPAQAILFFESTTTTPNACDDLTSLVPSGDPSLLLFGFADGHIEDVPTARREETLARSQEACKETALLTSHPPAVTKRP